MSRGLRTGLDDGVLGVVVATAILLVVGLLGAAGYLYASDHGFGADVTGVDCKGPFTSDSKNSVTLRTRFLAIERRVYGLSDAECSQVRVGYFVEHHIRSKHTIVYDREGGKCVYDTAQGAGC